MIIDCGRCAAPGDERVRADQRVRADDRGRPDEPRRAGDCRGCMIGALLDTPDGIGDLTPGELRAIETFELAGFDVELLETPAPPVAVPVPLFGMPGRVA
jgi:hypothetical protein